MRRIITALTFWALAAVMIMSILPGSIVISSGSGGGTPDLSEQTLTSSPTLTVDGDASLIALVQQNGWPGTGTLEDPFLMYGLEVNASQAPYGIYIMNTRLHLSIRYCSVYGAVGELGEPIGVGIKLLNVSNVIVSHCTLFNNDLFGIELASCSNVIISANEAYDHGEGAIHLVYSYDNQIISNDCVNSHIGIGLQYSERNEVRDNYLSGNSDSAVRTYFAHENQFYRNSFLYSGFHGIILDNSDRCVIDSNYALDNYVQYRLWRSNDSVVSNNYGSGHWHGLQLTEDSQRNLVVNNTFDSADDGIFVYGDARFNQIIGNDCSGCTNGIYIYGASDNEVRENVFHDCVQGLHIKWEFSYRSERNQIWNNVMMDNSKYGALVEGGRSNVISGNVFDRNLVWGMYLNSATANNQLFWNVFLENHGSNSTYNSSLAQAFDGSSSNTWTQSDRGNYWSDWTAPDDNANGIIDSPYVIGGSLAKKDLFPLASILRITSPAPGALVGSSLATVQGDLRNHLTISSLEWSNAQNGETGPCQPCLDWEAEVRLKNGRNDIHFTAVDHHEREFTADIVLYYEGPSIVMTPAPGTTVYTNQSIVELALELNGTDPLSNLTVERNFAGDVTFTFFEGFSGSLSCYMVESFTVEEGVNNFTLTLRDVNGRNDSVNITVVMDRSPPTLLITDPEEGSYLDTSDPIATWTVWDDRGVGSIEFSLDGSELTAAGTGGSELANLTEGPHTLIVIALDLAGNTAWHMVNFTVDTEPPSLSIVTPSDGAIINRSWSVIEWACDDATTGISRTEISVDGGAWTEAEGTDLNCSSLADGQHTVAVRVSDLAENIAAAEVAFIIDTTAPEVTISSPSQNSYVNSVSVQWTSYDLNGIALTEMRVDDGEWSVATGSDQSLTLSDGRHSVDLRATDQAGLMTVTRTSFTLDTVLPSVTIRSPAPGTFINDDEVDLEWTSSDELSGVSYVQVRIDSGNWMSRTGTSCTITSLSDGDHVLFVKVADRAGNVRTASVELGVSVSGPSVTFDPGSPVWTNDEGANITIKVSDSVPLISAYITRYVGDSVVDVQNVSGFFAGSREVTYVDRTSLAEGITFCTITINDSAGNSCTANYTLVRDSEGPQVSIGLADGSFVNGWPLVISWTAHDHLTDVAGYDVRIDEGNWTEASGTDISLQLADGAHTICVRAYDTLGNVGEDSIQITVDNQPPTAQCSPEGTGTDIRTVVTVAFSERMNVSSVRIVVAGANGTVTWNGDIATFTPIALEHACDYLVTVSGNDLAGNTVEMNWTFSTTPDTGTLTGKVVDEEGNPLANITVRVGDVSAVTNEIGRFILNGLTPTSYVLTVDAEGYEMYSRSVTVTAGGAEELGELTLVAEDRGDGADDGSDTLLIVAVIAIIAVAAVAAVVFLKRRM